jgi:hypothetical protein
MFMSKLSNWVFVFPEYIILGEMFYQAFRPIQPGSELFVWYGDSYGEFLEIEPFDPPRYYYAKCKYNI